MAGHKRKKWMISIIRIFSEILRWWRIEQQIWIKMI